MVCVSFFCSFIRCLATAEEGSIVLHRIGVDSSFFSSGIVVINRNKKWGNICRLSSFSTREADVICHQMTFSGSSSWSYGSDHRYMNT